ncbi:MAG: hypothetical protein AAF556_08115, partial [Pseudomonadota bacterium]
LCFDGDNAGQRAAFRAVERVLPHLAPDKTVRFATLPAGEDPDSLLRAGGKSQLLACLEAADSLVDKVWQLEVAERRLSTPESWAGLRAAIDRRVNSIAHEDLRGFYRQELQSRLREANYQQRQAQRSRRGRGARFEPAVKPTKTATTTPLGLRLVLKTIISHPVLVDEYHDELCALPFADPCYASLRDHIVDMWSADHEIGADALKEALIDAGADPDLQRLERGQGIEFVAFARADTALGIARAGLRETLSGLHAQLAVSELSQAARALAGDTMEEADPGRVQDRWQSINQAIVEAKTSLSEQPQSSARDADG